MEEDESDYGIQRSDRKVPTGTVEGISGGDALVTPVTALTRRAEFYANNV